MHLEKISIANFRNYETSQISVNSNLNLIYGLNAHGKTNLLEAIYITCLGRSFRLAKNEELLKSGTDSFTIDSQLILDNGIKKRVILRYKREEKKEISIDLKRVTSHAAVIGKFPIVIMSPDDYKITLGGPTERRRFVDLLLSQFNASYLKNLQDYQRILKQRNRILHSMREGRSIHDSVIQPWTQRLVEVGSQVFDSRKQFIEEFAPFIMEIYQSYTESKETLTMSLQSALSGTMSESTKDIFNSALRDSKLKERRLGITMVGPHKDDIGFEINGKSLRPFGSRGEHKSVLISLKLAEFKFLKQKRLETPIFLLDDFGSELDPFREKRVFESLQKLGQVFLTSPTEEHIHRLQVENYFPSTSTFYVREGRIGLS